jgi:hypothetical protein
MKVLTVYAHHDPVSSDTGARALHQVVLWTSSSSSISSVSAG